MIQDIAPWRLDNAFLPIEPDVRDLVLDLTAEGILLAENEPRLPCVEEWRAWSPSDNTSLIYAFRVIRDENASCDKDEGSLADERRFFLALRDSEASLSVPEGWRRTPPSALRPLPSPLPLAAATALHLSRWYDARRFCGRCGSALRRSERERAMLCPACGNVEYPVIAPCVIVAVTDKDRLLLTRYARAGAPRFVLVAGFVEIGETAEQAAAREVMEETGLKIKRLRYVGSQPWGLSGTLAIGFTAELDGSDRVRLDTSELSEAVWVKRDALPPCPDLSSLTMDMILRFSRGEL
ncbi:NAD(+) diphosphatase [Mailhella sp.]|uniref:NAD(+) diphosphatase n=1 Tax=Mailhella sp. TaxID=1981029 RepID=UPI003AB7C872